MHRQVPRHLLARPQHPAPFLHKEPDRLEGVLHRVVQRIRLERRQLRIAPGVEHGAVRAKALGFDAGGFQVIVLEGHIHRQRLQAVPGDVERRRISGPFAVAFDEVGHLDADGLHAVIGGQIGAVADGVGHLRRRGVEHAPGLADGCDLALVRIARAGVVCAVDAQATIEIAVPVA